MLFDKVIKALNERVYLCERGRGYKFKNRKPVRLWRALKKKAPVDAAYLAMCLDGETPFELSYKLPPAAYEVKLCRKYLRNKDDAWAKKWARKLGI